MTELHRGVEAFGRTRSTARRHSRGHTVRAEAWNTVALQLERLDLDRDTLRSLPTVEHQGLFEYEGEVEVAAHPTEPKLGVFIDGVLCAWTRDDCTDYVGPLRGLAAQHARFATHGRISWLYFPEWLNLVGAGPQSGSDGVISMPLPSELVPANNPPVGRVVRLPLAAPIKVARASHHVDVLAPWLHVSGSSAVYATLHPITEHRARSQRQVIEVQIEGSVVGRLSDRMSEVMLPLVAALHREGVRTVCLARIVGNLLAADVTVYPARPTMISNEWLAAALSTARSAVAADS